MACKNQTNSCGYDNLKVCPCDNYEDTITDEEFAGQLKHKVGDIVTLRGRRVRIDEVDITAHGWDDSCLPYKIVEWCSEDVLE